MHKATKRMTITRVTVAVYHADAVGRCDAAEVPGGVKKDRSDVLTFALYPGSELLLAAASA